MTDGYLIYQYRVTDRERVDELGPLVMPILARHGGRIVIASHVRALEGSPPTHVVVYRFDNVEAARAFHESPEHRELDALRHAVTDGFASLVEGFADEGPARTRGDGDHGPTPSDPNEDVPDVESILASLRDNGFSGTVLIARDGDLLARGFGDADRAAGVPNGPDVVHDIGSLTKQFTAAAVLRLRMDGRLSLDDPLSRVFPALPSEKGAITLHQLLTHTSGAPNALGGDYEVIDRDGFVDLFADAAELTHAPGSGYAYSNVGYGLLAAVVDRVSGVGYERYLHDALFLPAGLRATGYVLPDWSGHVIAIGYLNGRALGRPNERPWAEDGPHWHLRGNGGLLSTARDMLRWHEALLGDDVLDADARRLLYTPHTPDGVDVSTFYGYGWVLHPTVFDTLLVTHDGGNGVFFADFHRFLDEGVTIYVASNAVRRGRDHRISMALSDAIFGKPVFGLPD